MNANELEIQIEEISGSDERLIDGIAFRECLIIHPIIDGVKILQTPFYEDGLMVFEELINSRKCTGDYLIFTSACGVADDGGWGVTNVIHDGENIKWIVNRGDDVLEYNFSVDQYVKLLANVDTQADLLLDEGLKPEPEHFILPE